VGLFAWVMISGCVCVCVYCVHVCILGFCVFLQSYAMLAQYMILPCVRLSIRLSRCKWLTVP